MARDVAREHHFDADRTALLHGITVAENGPDGYELGYGKPDPAWARFPERSCRRQLEGAAKMIEAHYRGDVARFAVIYVRGPHDVTARAKRDRKQWVANVERIRRKGKK